MPKDALISLIVRITLGITVFESVTNAVFEWVGKTHNTPVWVATMVGGGIAVAMRAYWNQKKDN